MAYSNIYSLTRNPYEREDKPPGSRGTPPPAGTPTSPVPGPRPDTGGEPMPPGGRHPYPSPGPASAPAAQPPAFVDPGYASAAGGPAGVGGTGGFGFTNLAQYMYANPAQGAATTPTGMQATDYNPQVHGFTPNGGYTPGMAGVDNALNQVYQRQPPSGYSTPIVNWAGGDWLVPSNQGFNGIRSSMRY